MREWTDEQRALRDGYAESFAAWGAGHLERDRDQIFPDEQWKLIGDSGLLGLPFDREWGGQSWDLLTTMYVMEALGYGCRDGGLNFSVCTHMVSTGIPIHRFGSPWLKARYLPRICTGELIGAHAITEKHSGSDAAAMQTLARRQGDDLVVTGQKCFISNGPIADIFVVYAKNGSGRGPFGMTAFVVERDTPGVEVGAAVDKMGLRTSPLGDVSFDGCVVPVSNIIGQSGNGFLVLDHVMKWEILCSFAISVGGMQHRLERCVEFARSRLQFGSPIGSYQLVSSKIVDMKIGIETARRWLFDTADRLLQGANVMTEVAITKLLVSEANLKSAADAVHMFGGRGYLTEYGLEKDLRDATAGTIYSGTSEIQRNKIARILGVA